MVKNRLGKGLGALISSTHELEELQNEKKVKQVFIDQIEPNPFQPRQDFSEESLEELTQSIRENGIIQPVTLRQVSPEVYQIVTGERRWRAARNAGMKEIPALIRECSDQQMVEIALIENLQREDLNPIEEAQAYQKMLEEFAMTQEDLARRVGKGRSSIANMVRLLNLAPRVQVYVSRETISMGHARAILAIKEMKEQIAVADHVIKNNLSVRETEGYVQRLLNKNEVREINQYERPSLEPEWQKAQELLSDYLGTRVKIYKKRDRRLISIECKTYQDIEKILKRLDIS
jgi:ParB family transcriptional regulator, chromosome partitioning protein